MIIEGRPLPANQAVGDLEAPAPACPVRDAVEQVSTGGALIGAVAGNGQRDLPGNGNAG
jgi:hypothetical protein